MSSLRRIIPLIQRHPSSLPNNGIHSILQPISILSKPHGITTNTNTPPSLKLRALSTETKTKKNKNTKQPPTKNATPTTLAEHESLRALAKTHRTELYETKIRNRTRHKSTQRRLRATKDHLRTRFRSWFDNTTSRNSYLEREAKRRGLGWEHRVKVMVERLPTVTMDVEGWEEDWDMVRSELDRYGKVWPKELGFGDPMDDEVMTREQLMELLPEGYTPMPRETPADHSGFLRTLDRKLKTRVYLSIRPNDTDGWTFPTMDLRENRAKIDDETILDCAKRAVVDVCGGDLNVIYMSNCPMGVTVASYDELGIGGEEKEKEKSGCFGVKTWYMRVQYDSGSLDEKRLGETVGDWGWLDRDEMVERVKEEKGDEAGTFYQYML